MFDFISGVVASKRPEAVVIDVRGVGYACFVSLNSLAELPPEGAQATLLVHLNVREDALSLYGFVSPAERDLFRRLIAVAGVGPKLALALLSGITPDDLLRAVASADLARIKTIKGVGPKTAQRIIVDLADYAQRTAMGPAPSAPDRPASVRDQASAALMVLGFTEKDARKAVEKTLKTDPDAILEDIVRRALRSA